jgi:hypothetical protein
LELARSAADRLSQSTNQSYLGWNNYLQALLFVRDHNSTTEEEKSKLQGLIDEVEGKLRSKPPKRGVLLQERLVTENVVINMVHLRFIKRVLNESHCHKPMNPQILLTGFIR